MLTTLHPRLGAPSSYSVHHDDELVLEAAEAAVDPQDLDAAWAVEFLGRCIQVLAGERFLPVRDRNVHPLLFASLKAASGSRQEVRHPRVLVVRFQREPRVTRVAGVVQCGACCRGFTAEFRPAAAGWWLTHLGVL